MISTKPFGVSLLLIGLFLLVALSVQAAEPPQPSTQQTSEEELVKQTQNPVADLISVPLQNNFNFGTGSKNRTVWVGNLQPVIPIHITDDWNLITRTILPIINQPSLFPGMSSATGRVGVASNLEVSVFRFQVQDKVSDPDTRNQKPDTC